MHVKYPPDTYKCTNSDLILALISWHKMVTITISIINVSVHMYYEHVHAIIC